MKRVLGFSLFLLLCVSLSGPLPAFGAHKLVGSQCYDCHAVGASLADVVTDSRLIRNDLSKISDLVTNGWSTGTVLPCIYCHDGTSRAVRENMIGVQDHFTSGLSQHPVDPYTSSSDSTIGGDETGLDCIDCHDVSVVAYVKAGASPGTTLSPNIHGLDVGAVPWTPEPGSLNYTATYMDHTGGSTAGDPTNAGSNVFCTNQCHDTIPGTGVDANQVVHQFRTPLVSLETNSNLYTAAQIGGCLDETSSTGCHSVHFSLNATDLITAGYYDTTTPISRNDCGACHVFDDPPTNRNISDFFNTLQGGHGQSGIDLTCLNCHDSAIPHFQADGTSATGSSAGRLDFVLDSTQSDFSSPPKSVLSTCTTSSCHDGYMKHTAATNVGCLDCHDPHGYNVSPNVMMMRRTAPIASPTVTLSYANTGDWFNSAVSSGYTNWACDSADCHSSSTNAIMDIATGTHSGGTGIRGNCSSCHKHTGGPYSWAASCTDCHGTASSNFYPDGSTYPNRAGKHSQHVSAIANANSISDTNDATCDWCHPGGTHSGTQEPKPADLMDGSTTHFKDITGAIDSGESVAQNGTLDQVSCSGVDCHYDNPMANGDWYGTPTVGCDYCHTDDTAYDAGDLPLAHDIHVDEAASGGYDFTCATCHDTTGYTVSHMDGGSGSSIVFSGTIATTWVGATYDSGTMQCDNLYCHGNAPPQSAQFDSTGSVACGTCHGAVTTGRPDSATDPSGGNHLTSSHQIACTECHTNDDTDRARHVNGPVSANSAARVSASGSSISSFSYGASAHTNSPDPDGYNYTGSSCTPTCHQQGTWGGTGGCTFCHGGSDLYYPQTASIASTDYPDRQGEHAAHIAALEAKIGYSAGTTNDAEQQHMCEYCHNDVNGVGGANHGDNVIPADVGSFNGIWSTANPPGAADANGAITGAKTCQDVDCHYDGTGTDTTPDSWYGTGTAGCDYCHTDGTPYAIGDLPLAHDVHVNERADTGYGFTCTICHTSNTDDWHANGSAGGDISFTGIAATWASVSWNDTQNQCSNLFCHGAANTADWDGGTGGACGDCHGAAGTGRPDNASEPTGGNHLTTSHQVTCSKCHTHDGTNTAEHVDGPQSGLATALVSAGGSSITSFTYGGTSHTSSPDPDGYEYTGGSCTPTCHGNGDWGGTGGCNFCHGYPPDGVTAPSGFTAVDHDSMALTTNHDDCSYCHGVKDNGSSQPSIMGTGVLKGSYIYSWTADHRDGSITMNGNNNATSADDAGYVSGGALGGGCSTAACHANDATHRLADANTVQMRDLGPGECGSCHFTGVGGATIVNQSSTHIDADGAGSTYDTAGGNFCTNCHDGHYAGTNGVQIPNPPTFNSIALTTSLGIHYTMAGHGGIAIGGTSTAIVPSIRSVTTEAGICWGCHDSVGGISEWGTTTTDTNSTFPNYNYGSLWSLATGGSQVSNWVGAYWRSAVNGTATYNTVNFSYKTETVQSTHAANPTSGTAGTESVSAIRCSYCHDVHGTKSGSPTASPYLRGTWMQNPYREDGAPRAGVQYSQEQMYGAVPRGNASPNSGHTSYTGQDQNKVEYGGYWIDQNSAFPTDNTSWDTPDEFAGLCELCHGDGDGSWDTTNTTNNEIDALNLTTGGFATNNWFGANGHSNSVKGGRGTAGTSEANVLTLTLRGYSRQTSISAGDFSGNNLWQDGGMGYFGQSNSNRVYGTRNNDEDSFYWDDSDRGTGVFPPAERMTGTTAGEVRYVYDAPSRGAGFEWGSWVNTTWPALTHDNATTDNMYHQFTCSKCHNPHASRLPRLMITNCLDVDKNNWDDQSITYTSSGSTTSGTALNGDADWTTGDNSPYTNNVQSPGSQELAYTNSAQNCHRETQNNDTDGWNKITPW